MYLDDVDRKGIDEFVTENNGWFCVDKRLVRVGAGVVWMGVGALVAARCWGMLVRLRKKPTRVKTLMVVLLMRKQ